MAQEGSAVAAGIDRLAKADPAFNPQAFLDGARRAYETVLDAFAKGDLAALKGLLSRDVYEGFAKAIASR